ncbi:hypothetical protein ACFLU6_11000 [Acidobacteriota bacterium]
MADSVILLATTFFAWAIRQCGKNVLESDQDGIPRQSRGAKPGIKRRKVGRPRKAVTVPIQYSGLGLNMKKGSPPVVFNINLKISTDTKKEDLRRIFSDLKDELLDF